MYQRLAAITLALLLAACDSSPGPLAGSWKAQEMPMTSTFRPGEMETMGVIEKVDYRVEDKAVVVTMKDGMAKGTAVRYVLVNPSTVKALGMTYRKVGN